MIWKIIKDIFKICFLDLINKVWIDLVDMYVVNLICFIYDIGVNVL